MDAKYCLSTSIVYVCQNFIVIKASMWMDYRHLCKKKNQILKIISKLTDSGKVYHDGIMILDAFLSYEGLAKMLQKMSSAHVVCCMLTLKTGKSCCKISITSL